MEIISHKTKLIVGLLIVLASSSFGIVAQQSSSFDDLEKYLNKEMAGPEATKVIKAHLIESTTDAPMENLVAWAKAGFPDLHDEHGIWKTEAISVKLGMVKSIRYYFSTSPPADKSARYLAILDELRSDDYISYHLVGLAHEFVDQSMLKGRVDQLLPAKDRNLRS